MLARSPFSASSRSGNIRAENLGQNALIMIANLCFSVFVIGALIFTIIAVTFDLDDSLFFHPSSKITNFLYSNPTFSSDHSEIEAYLNLTEVNSAVAGAEFEEEGAGSETRECRVDDPIDCRDPDVFHLLMRAAIDKFKDIHFYRFGKPVRGDDDSSCHMAWRFRPKGGKAGGFNKDYRSFSVVRSANCTVSVVAIGEYHSGGNARMKKGGKGKVKEKGSAKEVSDKMPEKAEDSLNAPPDNGETVNDELPTIESEESFSRGRYLVYSGGGDRCKDMNHYIWGFMCMLGEAQFLNRTLVMDLTLCLSKIYSSSGVDEEGKDFRFYFDFEHLKDSASVVEQAQFWDSWKKWQERDRLTLHLVEEPRVTPMKLTEVKDTLIMRKFGIVEPDNYWHRVCDGKAAKVIQRPWGMIWKSRRLLDIASAIASRMNWDFDTVHVQRGEKVKNKKLWPNLDRDTSPKSLLEKLKGKVEEGRDLYIATDERDTAYFDPLKEKYSTHFLDDHKDLWEPKSDWYYEMMKLNNGNAVEFDGYMRTAIDSEVFIKGKKQIETFNDLTTDCKDGVNTC